MRKVMLISIKPEFTEKIFNGSKSIELRKSNPKIFPGDMILIYCTVPVKAVVGFCRVESILKMSPSELWSQHRQHLGIDRKRYQDYYENHNVAVGIVLTDICRFDRMITLESIKEDIPNFSPPQTFRYFEWAKLPSNLLLNIE